ncbi:MAG: NYN domain-containing protein [Bacteroidota bacterium]
MVFIDGTWLYSSLKNLGEDFQIDYGKLPKALGKKVGEKLNDPNTDIVRTFLFGSNATNFQDADQDMVTRRRIFYDVLREDYGYDVEVYLVDYRGRRLRKKDRHQDDEFYPEEKCVDIALASSMLYFAALPYVYDIAILVGGDRDFVPVLNKVRQLGKRIAIASIHHCCSFELMEGRNLKGVRDFDVIWLEDILDDIRLTPVMRPLFCKSPLHTGENPIMTEEYVRKNRPFLCRDCREKMRREREGFTSEPYHEQSEEADFHEVEEPAHVNGNGNGYRESQAAELHTGDTCQGIIKRMLDYSGFIESPQGDFYFAMNDCASNTEFQQLRRGMRVEFIVSKLPNRDVRGSKGNGNAEEVAIASEY